MNMPDFRPGQSAGQAHQALKQSVEIMDRAQHCAVLWFAEIMKRRLYRELGYSSMYQYASEELGFPRPGPATSNGWRKNWKPCPGWPPR